jgi:uncharacterized membrane protein YoaT (DUF817 family)
MPGQHTCLLQHTNIHYPQQIHQYHGYMRQYRHYQWLITCLLVNTPLLVVLRQHNRRHLRLKVMQCIACFACLADAHASHTGCTMFPQSSSMHTCIHLLHIHLRVQ